MPFGLASAPQTFSKIMVVVVVALCERGIRVHPYSDDWLIWADSLPEAHVTITRVVHFLENLGWVINCAKSCLQPSQVLNFLGARFDTCRRTQEQFQKLLAQLQQFLHQEAPWTWDYLQLLGSMAATIDLVPWARAHMRSLQTALLSRSLVSEDYQVRLPLLPVVKLSLRWWLQLRNLFWGMSLETPCWILITTDASLSSWGAH